jgi:Ras-related GTP-binding protein A/B
MLISLALSPQKDLRYYKQCLEAIRQNSKDAKIFCLIHKMDLVPEDQREKVFKTKEAEILEASNPQKVVCFRTSIWDETLYKVSLLSSLLSSLSLSLSLSLH